jgi:ubiquinone biosynthesis protein COQ4
MDQNRVQPIVALQAIRRLIADPERTHEVFTIIRALSGPALQKGFERFAATETGQKVLREKADLLDTLQNHQHLQSLPADSLGRHYLHFVTTENLSAGELVEASGTAEIDQLEGDLARFATRQRDMHDLWHVLTGYGRDTLGELCLLSFTYAQTKNRGVGFICFVGAQKLRKEYGHGVYRAAWQAYKDGKKAAWLPAQDWEALLAMPIDELRQRLDIRQPRDYVSLRGNVATA